MLANPLAWAGISSTRERTAMKDVVLELALMID